MYLFAFFLVLYEFTTYSANDMIMPGMIQVVRDFHAPLYYVALSLSFYILGNCIFLIMAGYLSERHGKRRVMLVGNLLFLIFTIIILFSRNIHQFMLWRFFQGSGLSIIAIGYAIIHKHFDDKRAIKIAALMANVSMLAPLIGPLIGSVIMSYSSWEYIFVLSTALSIVTLIGLYFFIPKDNLPASIQPFSEITKQYVSILRNREFIKGMFCSVLAVTSILIWISQAPNLILYKLHQDYTHYVIYQIISIGGLTLSSILMQYIVGRYKLYSIVKLGNLLLLTGVTISLVGFNNIDIIVIGLSIYSLGMGMVNGCMMRLIMSIKGYSHGILATTFGFMQMFLFVIAITLLNEYFSYFEFSLPSFTISSFVFGLISFFLITNHIAAYRERGWH